MRDGPSLTARAAAAHRAVHQVLEGGRVFRDVLAEPILGEDIDRFARESEAWPGGPAMRLFIAARSRFAEDSLAGLVEAGLRQYVVLGAGLDTFGCRGVLQDAGLRVFEVDHPATQAWKRRRLADAGITAPASLVFAPVDFERETLGEGLARAGFDLARPAFFAWLGVVVYLTRDVVFETLRFIAERPAPSGVVFDYGEPIEAYAPERRPAQMARAEMAAAMGEPWITRFRPDELARELRAIGFDEIEDLGPRAIGARFLGAPGHDRPGGHLMRAMRTA